MPNFANAVQKAIKNVASIQGVGQDVTIRTITAGSYNTTTGVISESNSDATVKAVLEDVNMREVNVAYSGRRYKNYNICGRCYGKTYNKG